VASSDTATTKGLLFLEAQGKMPSPRVLPNATIRAASHQYGKIARCFTGSQNRTYKHTNTSTQEGQADLTQEVVTQVYSQVYDTIGSSDRCITKKKKPARETKTGFPYMVSNSVRVRMGLIYSSCGKLTSRRWSSEESLLHSGPLGCKVSRLASGGLL
jgi:hypothetical protein